MGLIREVGRERRHEGQGNRPYALWTERETGDEGGHVPARQQHPTGQVRPRDRGPTRRRRAVRGRARLRDRGRVRGSRDGQGQRRARPSPPARRRPEARQGRAVPGDRGQARQAIEGRGLHQRPHGPARGLHRRRAGAGRRPVLPPHLRGPGGEGAQPDRRPDPRRAGRRQDPRREAREPQEPRRGRRGGPSRHARRRPTRLPPTSCRSSRRSAGRGRDPCGRSRTLSTRAACGPRAGPSGRRWR